MTTRYFNDVIAREMQNDAFAHGVHEEMARLDSAVALRRAREAAGLTQRELAALSGKTQAMIARAERGDNITFETLTALAAAMNKQVKIEIV